MCRSTLSLLAQPWIGEERKKRAYWQEFGLRRETRSQNSHPKESSLRLLERGPCRRKRMGEKR